MASSFANRLELLVATLVFAVIFSNLSVNCAEDDGGGGVGGVAGGGVVPGAGGIGGGGSGGGGGGGPGGGSGGFGGGGPGGGSGGGGGGGGGPGGGSGGFGGSGGGPGGGSGGGGGGGIGGGGGGPGGGSGGGGGGGIGGGGGPGNGGGGGGVGGGGGGGNGDGDEGGGIGGPAEIAAKALYCFDDRLIYTSCEESCRLTARGNLNVPPDYTDEFCGGPCFDETKSILDCIDGIMAHFLFYNKATTEDVRETIKAGCGYGDERGNFNVAEHIQADEGAGRTDTAPVPILTGLLIMILGQFILK